MLPILFVNGSDDEIVPYAQSMKLVDAAKKSIYKQVYTLLSGKHNDTWRLNSGGYMEALGNFMRDALNFAPNLQVIKE